MYKIEKPCFFLVRSTIETCPDIAGPNCKFLTTAPHWSECCFGGSSAYLVDYKKRQAATVRREAKKGASK